MDYYLKFNSEEQANNLLITDEVFNYKNVDVIGTIYLPNGEEFIPTEGWHVNVRLVDGEDGSALEPFKVAVTTPYRTWA